MPKSDLTAFFARIFVSQPGHIVIFEMVNWFLSQINQVKIHGTWLFRPILSVKWILIYPTAKKANTLTKNPIFLIGDFYMALLTYKNSCKKSCKVTFGDKESQIICLYDQVYKIFSLFQLLAFKLLPDHTSEPLSRMFYLV